MASSPLLATKLYVPPVRSTLVSRPHLVERLAHGLRGPLTLLSAPAGYGKTTLFSEWRAGPGTSISLAWLSLDTRDNDPSRFFHYLLTSLDAIGFPAAQDLLPLLQSPELPDYENLLILLTNALNENAQEFVLAFDDYHVIEMEAIHTSLAFLIDHLPAHVHLALLTRTDPPLPLARLRARNQLVEIRQADLCFSLDETTLFLNAVMELNLSAEDLGAIEARTEGWIAGLQLAALSLQGCTDLHGYISAFTGSHRYIMDYLTEEVLRLQPVLISTFLLYTSILDRLSGPLCEAVMDASTDQPLDGQAILEALDQSNLFVVPLDGERRWYRYHHLFADVLKKRLEHQFPHLLPELHRRASQWYEQNGFISEAIQQAVIAGDHERSAQLIEQNGCYLLIAGEVTTFLNWTDIIEFQSESCPWLAIQQAWALALTGKLDRVEQTLQAPERLLRSLEPTIEVKTMLGTIDAARAYCANSRMDTQLAAEYARQALVLLPDCSSISQSIRSVATSVLGDASWINGDLEQATRAYSEAVRIGSEAGNLHMVIIGSSNLAEVLMEQGQLHRAAEIYADTLRLTIRPDGQRSPLAGSIYIGLCRLAYETNRLHDAKQNIHQCLELCRKWGDADLQASAYALQARLEFASGNLEEAQEAMLRIDHHRSEHSLSSRRSIQAKYDLSRLQLAQGNLEWLSQSLQKSGLQVEDEISYPRVADYIILLRFLLARGDNDTALKLSQRLLQQAETAGRVSLVIEILVLQALVYQGKKDTERAMATLERALSLAQSNGYVRLFLDEGQPLTRLLCQLQSRRIGSEYAAELLSMIGQTPTMIMPSMQLLVEPLTVRELEVLRLIEAGCSNQDISAQLFISIPTVKRHISNIYSKLGVQSRTQAISLGKELNLFG